MIFHLVTKVLQLHLMTNDYFYIDRFELSQISHLITIKIIEFPGMAVKVPTSRQAYRISDKKNPSSQPKDNLYKYQYSGQLSTDPSKQVRIRSSKSTTTRENFLLPKCKQFATIPNHTNGASWNGTPFLSGICSCSKAGKQFRLEQGLAIVSHFE